MKIVLQRVKEAHVSVDGKITGQINQGLLIFLGIAKEDTTLQADYLVKKVAELRIFEDSEGKMNRSALEVGAQFLVVSQFTLYGDCSKGRRPSFDQAAEPEKAQELYEYFIQALRRQNVKVATGVFRAMMEVALINDGPVTLVVESV